MGPASSPRAQTVVRWVSIGALVAGLLLLGWSLPLDRIASWLEASVRAAGPWAPLAFGAAYVAAALLLLPGSVFTLGAGALFGPLVGTVVVSLASTTAAALAFLIGRYLARDAVARAARARPVFGAIDRAVAEGGWKVVALLRLSPLVPFSMGNYLFGLTRVGLVPYVLASWVAMLPGTFLYVYLGHVGQAAARGGERTVGQWALLAAGLAATLVVTVYLTRLARRALRERATTVEDAPAPAVDAAPAPRRPWRLGLLATSGVAALTAGLLTSCGILRFGPPEVTLREAYGDAPGSATFDHSAFDALLSKYVDEQGLVDYPGLRDQVALQVYLDQLARVDLDTLGRDERLALLINAYNAFTLRLILDHYPLDSIRDIPADQRWDGRTWTLGGRQLTLSQLENEEVRPKFREPRVHFALVCAALGCPPLRREAYVGARLEAQLEDQARQVHADPRWFRYDPGSSSVSLATPRRSASLEPRWTTSRKDGVGAAYSTASKVWFTTVAGVVTEVYFPTIDRPQVRDLQLLFTDGSTFFHDERDLDVSVEYLADHALGLRVTAADRAGRYHVTKELIADPHQPCVLMHVKVSGDAALLEDLRVFVLVAPHLEVGGRGNNANVARCAGRDVFHAEETTATDTALGISYVDLPVPLDQAAPIRFTFLWLGDERWEGRDFAVSIDPNTDGSRDDR